MFQKGEFVIHGVNGVCRVEDIVMLNMPGSKNQRKCYVLQPVKASASRVFFPVDSDKVPMRKILTRQEAEDLLSDASGIEPLNVPNEKLREDTYKQALKTIDCKYWIGMMKTLYGKRKERLAMGRKFTAVDERYLKSAEDALYQELSVALDKERKDVEHLFADSMSE